MRAVAGRDGWAAARESAAPRVDPEITRTRWFGAPAGAPPGWRGGHRVRKCAPDPVAGMGRETVSALAGTPAGWAAVVRHTAGAQLDDVALSAPADPYGGAALFFRGE